MIFLTHRGIINRYNPEYAYSGSKTSILFCIGMGVDHFYMGISIPYYWIKITKESAIFIASGSSDRPFSYFTWSTIGYK